MLWKDKWGKVKWRAGQVENYQQDSEFEYEPVGVPPARLTGSGIDFTLTLRPSKVVSSSSTFKRNLWVCSLLRPGAVALATYSSPSREYSTMGLTVLFRWRIWSLAPDADNVDRWDWIKRERNFLVGLDVAETGLTHFGENGVHFVIIAIDELEFSCSFGHCVVSEFP